MGKLYQVWIEVEECAVDEDGLADMNDENELDWQSQGEPSPYEFTESQLIYFWQCIEHLNSADWTESEEEKEDAQLPELCE